MNRNFKTTIRNLTQAGILASLFVASSAQAVFISTYNFCPDGSSHTNVVQYEYLFKPTMLWVALSVSGGERVDKSKIMQPGSWYSEFNASQSTPVSNPRAGFSHMTVIMDPGFVNMQGYHQQVMPIRDIVPNTLYSGLGAIISYPGCMAVQKNIQLF